MPRKSIWESNLWKTVVAIGIILGIISSALQISGKVDFWVSLILPIVNFFMIPIPLYSIPLAFFIFLAILFALAYASSGSPTISNPFYRAEILDEECARYMALLCRTPRTVEFLKSKYEEYRRQYEGYSFEYCLKELENRELLRYQDGKWVATQKALDYIAKYHGDTEVPLLE